MNPISLAFRAQIFAAPTVEPDFSFLPRAEIPCAAAAYQNTSWILKSNPRPVATLFDVDETLQREKDKSFIGRTIGSLYAFVNAGVPVGLFSIRPESAVQIFLSECPQISKVLARDSSGRRLTFDNVAFTEMTRDVCAGTRHAILWMEHEISRVDRSVTIMIPHIELECAGATEEINAPKFSPAPGVLIVDDKDYGKRYRIVLNFLRDNGEYGTSLYYAALRSLGLLWNVDKAKPGEGFSDAQLLSLAMILERITR